MYTVEENMKSRRILSGMMSVAMLFSMAATPVYAIEEQAVPGAPDNTYSEPMNGTPEEDNTYKETETNAPVEPADTQAQPDSVPDDAGIGGQPDGTENPAPLALNAPAPLDAGETFAEVAEKYYGNNGSQRVGELKLSWVDTDQQVYAGETFQLSVHWVLDPAGTYSYATHPELLFDTYDNTTITLTLPEGVSIVDGTAATIEGVTHIEQNGNQWKLYLDAAIDAKSTSQKDIMLPLKLDGNGTRGIGEILSFISQSAWINTQFTILDRTDPGGIKPDKTYTKVIKAAEPLDNLTTATQDKWGIQKSPVTATPDENKQTITATYTLQVGLIETTSSGEVIVTNPDSYGRPGRVPFTSVTLTELPRVTDRDGDEIQAQSITVTPKFGTQTPIEVPSAGDTVTLLVDTCAGKSISSSLVVDSSAPYLSEYTVTVVYPYEDFIAEYYEEKQDKLTIGNSVTLNYALKGGQAQTATSTAQLEAGEVTQPAQLDISKYILDADNTPKLYSNTNFPAGDPVSGPATFTITTKDGNAATLYKKEANDTYTKLDSNAVAIDPAGAGDTGVYTGTDGTVTVYLDPGEYTIQESGLPQNTEKATGQDINAEDRTVTIAAGETGTAAFYNTERVGTITVHKTSQVTGGTSQILGGAKFGLYADSACTGDPIKEATSDATTGDALFGRLPYDTYYIKEISAPDGYIKDEIVYPVTLSEDNQTVTQNIVNKDNHAPVLLQKQMFDGTTYVNVGEAYYQEFDGRFSIQKKNGGTWEPLADEQNRSLSSVGQYATMLPVYDDAGNLITYRFAETLPAGWHAAGGVTEVNGVVYSQEFTLEDYAGNPTTDPYKVTMQNDRNGSITLTKNFYDITRTGYAQATDTHEASFTLYTKNTDGKLMQYDTESYTTSNGQLEITNLPRDKEYYLVENAVAGYVADPAQTGNNTARDEAQKMTLADGVTEVTAWGPFDFESDGTNPAKLDQTITVNNYQNKIGIIVKKQDSITNAFVSGAEFTVYEKLAYKSDPATATPVVEATAIPDANGVFITLDPGKEYIIVETTVPANYTDVTLKGGITVDLKNASIVYDKKPDTYTLLNRPDPKLLVNKTVTGNNKTDAPVTMPVTFEVYQKEGNAFTPVKDSSGNTLTITSGTAASLPEGTYYLKETVPSDNPNHILDPNQYAGVYEEDPDVKGEKVEDSNGNTTFYFGPVDLKTVTRENNQTQTFEVKNYSEYGTVTVTKYAKTQNGDEVKLGNATLAIYKEGSDTPVKTVTTGTNGTATFTGLPIYDEKGNKITYTIRETAAPTGYTVSDTVLTVQLEPGKTVTKGTDKNELKIVNLPQVTFKVAKVFYNIWDHAFSGKVSLLPGAQIALYQKQKDGSYKWVATQTTNVDGEVNFTGLSQIEEYVAVEYSIPNVQDYAYLEPIEEDKEYLSKDHPDAAPPTLSAAELEKYYYVTKGANKDIPVATVSKTLTNVEHWAQLNIKKWKQVDDYEAADPTWQEDEEYPVNNAEFDLYMQVLDDTNQTELTYTDGSPDYTLVGHYSSGTLYSADGKRLDGWFGTDILKSADNVVYWLVEHTPGTGAKVNPATEITLIKRQGTQYTNNSTAISDDTTLCTEYMVYQDDTVTKGDVQNLPAEGPGTAMFSTVRIAKWAGSIDAEGNKLDKYTPLGNATFELWVTDADGNPVALLDTITTGLDNDLTGKDKQDLTAWASSRAFSFEALWDIYAKQNDPNVPKDIIWVDDQQGAEAWEGNGYLRIMLFETKTPAGYSPQTKGIPMLMYFDYQNGKTTEIFNDAFYVKGDNSAEKLTDTLSPDAWPCYPTREQTNGSYEKVPGVDGEQYRIVDWPVDNFAVTVYKFGYTVNSDNTNMTAAQLDEYYQNHTGRVPLNGVTMKLQRYDSATAKWADYTYPGGTAATFKTNENGYFVFPNGLRVGRYRIIETNAPAGYEKIYDGTSLAEGRYFDKKAYYFIVTTESVHISLYNPEKLSLSIKKQNMAGIKVTAQATFALKPATGSTITGSTVDGVATLTGIGSSVYTLSETAAPTGYTAAYLQQYLLATYANNKTTVNGTEYTLGCFAGDKDAATPDGIYLGYTTEQKPTGEYTGETVVTRKIDLSSYGVSDLVLDIQDPALCSLTITKEDAQNPNIKLKGAVFKLERKDFTSWSGEETVDADGSWTLVDDDLTTDENGIATTGNTLQPGIYKVTETTAPDDYSLDTTPQYVVLTGGMSKTVTMDGKALNMDTGLTFRDLKKVNLTLTKTINTGSLTLGEEHTFTFTLTGPNGYSQEQKVTFAQGAANNASETAIFTGLEQGKTYTMTETFEKADTPFELTKVEVDGTQVTPDASKSWTVTVEEDGNNVTVNAENTYLYAELKILKVNGNNGSPLNGAAFKAYRIKDGQPMSNHTGTVTPVQDKPGEYVVRVPLTSKDGDSFQIKEISAPAGYLEEHPQIIVELKPGESETHGDYDKDTMGTADRDANDAAMLAERIFPNYPGAVINIIKYDNMKEATTSAPLQGAAFTLYSKAANGTWQFVTTETTGDAGKVTFTVPGNMRYAVTESTVPEGYQSLQGLWDQNGNAMGTKSDAGRTYYLIGSEDLKVGDNYTFYAYNVPWVEMEIQKQNVLTPNDPNKTPTATVDIYEVPGDTPQQLTQQQVETLTNTADLVLKGVSVVSKQVQKPPYYSYADKSTTTALGTSFAAGKTYLVVETDASISQIRDNSQVVWYAVHTIPAGTKEKQVVMLKNLEGTATQTLSKTATTTDPFKSLLSQAATLEYTLTPTVSNTYPLDEYVITDSGLAAYNGDTELAFDSYLKDKYSITQVTLSGFSHNSANYNGGTAVQDLQATVKFYGFDNQEIYSKTVAATDEAKVVNLSGTQKAKYVTVSYASPSLLKSTGYALGQDFKPGTVKVTIRLDKQQGGEDVQAITKVVNTATSTLKYTPWTTTGAKGTQVTDTQGDTAENTFGEVETALVSITKAAEETAVNLDGGKIHYTVTLNNLQSAKADMQDPFIVDLLPQGTRFVDNSIQIQGEGVELENSRTETKNGETALFVFLKGNLSPGKSVDIELQLESTTSVALHGSQIANFVFAGSRVQGAQSRDNPLASSFKTSGNQWPKGIGETVTSLDKTRLPTLEEILDTMKGFGYIGSRCDVNWTTTSAATLIKTGKGDRSEDQGFSDSQLSTVNNGGSMQYQLIFSNLSASENYTDTTLLDVFPFEGDQVETGTDRGSKWGMNFESVLSVQKLAADGTYTDIEPANYEVFYYTDRVTEDNIANVYDQAEKLKFDTATPEQGWTTNEDQKTNATAIAVAIKKVEDAAIAPKQSYVVTLQLKVDTYDTDELAELSWTNAVNNFVCHYSAYTQGQDIGAALPRSLMSSNSVSNTILPNPVKVGGHIWIDKDADGVWDDGESVSATDLQQSALVQKLLKQAEIRLYTYRGSSDTSSSTDEYIKTADKEWATKANFVFEGLDSATPLDNAKENQLYGNTEPNKPLNPMYLKGYPDVKTYRIGVTVPTTSGILYRITSLGGGDPDKKTGYSRDPNQLAEGGQYEDEAKDNNYLKYSSTTSASEQFYLYATDPAVAFDNTKDIGFVLQRDLVINKTAATDPNVKLQGAEFKVYGPFDSVGAANQATLHDDGADKNLVTTVTTDASGQATIQGLNWFQCYVIVESKPAPNYRLEGADGKSSDAPLTDYTGQATSNPAWVLGIPENTSTVTTQHMNVTNKTDVQYSIAATKALEGTALKDQQFQFELLDESMQRIKTAYNIGDVVDFGKFDANAAGTVTYYIREMIPAGAQGDVFQDIRYDTALYKVVVTITTDQTTGKLVPSVAYYRNSGSAQQSAVFTNVYLPAQRTNYQPAVLKQFTEDSDPRPSDAYFTFTLEPQADYGAAVELPIKAGDTVCKVQVHSGGPAYFDPIWFNEEGVYRFTIREVNEGKVGYRYDTATWTLEVQTVKSDGKLVVARADYSVDGKGGYTIAEFVNYYEEGLPSETPSQDGTLPATTGDAFIAQTSDPSNPVLWVVLMVVALVGVGVAFWLKKRGRNRK